MERLWANSGIVFFLIVRNLTQNIILSIMFSFLPKQKRIIPADRFDEWEYNSFSNGINNPPWTGQGEGEKKIRTKRK